MTSPRKRVPANNGAQKKSRRRAGIVLGFLMGVAGTVLILLNYSTSPAPTYIGIVLFLLGFLIMGISALMRDRLNGHR